MSHWQPTASLANLRLRANILAKIRAFFATHNVLEVETPQLSQATVTDIHLQSFDTQYQADGANLNNNKILYLQTSPEFAMKRLLAAGSGAIFQICKAYRNQGESGSLHNPEFTLLEWYRPGYTHHDLMDETDQLLQMILTSEPAERCSYAEVFLRHTNINPHLTTVAELKEYALQYPELVTFDFQDQNSWLYLLMTHLIEPRLGLQNKPTFIYDFPVSQAALACIRSDNPPVAERFEVYIAGIELANGFHELTNAKEQQQRFLQDIELRKQLDYPLPPIDKNLLAALEYGMPDCSGIALGIDRLVMLAAKTNQLADVISFPLGRA